MRPLRQRQIAFTLAYVLFAILAAWFVRSIALRAVEPTSVPYSELLQMVQDHRVEAVEVREDSVVAQLKPDPNQPGKRPPVVEAERLPRVDETPLLEALTRTGTTFSGRIQRVPLWQEVLVSAAPMLLLLGVYFIALRRMRRNASPMSFGRNHAKVYDVSQDVSRVNFNDVAGVDESKAELVEVVDYLKNPAKYQAVGARIPKGVLLVGPPGTGKTLLARAVAGEAGVSFFSLSGSEFVEMFVGVGAARVRDLFEQAKQRAPCIVFIDELDAIGRSRGGIGAVAIHDEREQTLNQLLVEMDGFDPAAGVVIMASTNRPEVLDPALLRAGRFDRQVVVDRPDLQGREEILRVHARHVKLAPSVDLGLVARRTPGMVGADLANVVNEAALLAARRGGKEVEQHDFEDAIDRLQLGLKRSGRAMGDDEKRRVAYHESGHTLIALSVEHSDPVHRVTIIPRSIGALGATLQLPAEEKYLMTRAELEDRICVMLGGRAAEEVCCGDISTGAHNDLERATETARQMICQFGMSDRLGPVTFGQPSSSRFLSLPGMGDGRNFSEQTAIAIDEEVRRIVDSQHDRAREIVRARRAGLQAIAERLLVRETLERDEVERLLHGTQPAPIGRGASPWEQPRQLQ